MKKNCPLCGSDKIARGAQLLDHIGDSGIYNNVAEARVFAKPEAFILKDGYRGQVTLDVCGECGHATINVSNHRDLYRAYLASVEGKEK